MSRQSRAHRLLGPVLCLAIFGCSEDPTSPIEPGPDPVPGPGEEPTDTTNVAPEIGPIADAIVVRNTLSPRTLALDLELVDPDDDVLEVVIESDDESVLAGQSLECSPGTCAVTLMPSPERTAAVNVQVTATAGRGGEAMAEFRLEVLPRLVTNADDSGPGSLRAAVADSEPGDVIGFDTASVFAGPQTIELQEQIVLDEVLTIEGPGADRLALSGGDAVRIFRANEGADVIIIGVTITKGRAPLETFSVAGTAVDLALGGGVLVDAGAKLTLSACAITASVAVEEGNAAFGGGIASFEGTLVVNEGTQVTGNTAVFGGGVASLSFKNERQATAAIADALIAGNEATPQGGGGIYNHGGSLVVHAGVIRENTATRGAGIQNEGRLTVGAGSIVIKNTATSAESGVARSGGGGIFNDDGATATITGSTIEANTAVTKGGGIRNHGALEAGAGTLIRDNRAGATGGGVHNGEGGEATILGSTIEANQAESGGGVSNRAEMRIQDSRIAQNSATELGGGYLQDHRDGVRAETLIENTVIENNTAAIGGGVTNGDGEVIIQRNSLIADNVATTGFGGGIENRQMVKGVSQTVTVIDSSTITGNRAHSAGGGIHNWDADLTLRNGTILSDNHANLEGGGLRNYARQNAVTIEASLIGTDQGRGGNSARDGGGIYNYGGLIELKAGTRVQGNVAEIRGGGALNSTLGTIVLGAEARVTGNTVTEIGDGPVGGGIYNLGKVANTGAVTGNTPDDIVP